MAEDRHAAFLSPAALEESFDKPEIIPFFVHICTLNRVCEKVQRACADFEEEAEEAGDMTVKVSPLDPELEFEVDELFVIKTLLLK